MGLIINSIVGSDLFVIGLICGALIGWFATSIVFYILRSIDSSDNQKRRYLESLNDTELRKYTNYIYAVKKNQSMKSLASKKTKQKTLNDEEVT